MVDAISMALKIIIILLATAGLVSGKAVRNEREAVMDDGSTICYGDLGCFGIDTPFYSSQRLINLFPASPDSINTTFRLFTRKNLNDDGYQILSTNDFASLRNSFFNSSTPTKMVVHGFLDNGLLEWMTTMKDELLKAGDFNVILTDWGKGSGLPYIQATANTRVVGGETAKLITALKEQVGATPEDFHIIGHSLGAHICGYAGERLANLGRITGLDPAGPYFQYTDEVVRLDPTDAKFVDVIHTDGRSIMELGYGIIQPVGHVDFYPNGGMNQPGCDKNPITTLLSDLDVYKGVTQIVACNHLRALDYFTESINSVCPFQGYRCNKYNDFKRGICMACSKGGCGRMGFYGDRFKPSAGTTNVKYFLDTGYHYQIQLSFGNVSHATTERGILMVSLMGTNGQLEEKALTDGPMDIKPGKTYGFVVTSTHELGIIRSARVSWHRRFSITDVRSWASLLGTKSPSVYISRLKIVNRETNRRVKFCGKNDKIETDTYFLLKNVC